MLSDLAAKDAVALSAVQQQDAADLASAVASAQQAAASSLTSAFASAQQGAASNLASAVASAQQAAANNLASAVASAQQAAANNLASAVASAQQAAANNLAATVLWTQAADDAFFAQIAGRRSADQVAMLREQAAIQAAIFKQGADALAAQTPATQAAQQALLDAAPGCPSTMGGYPICGSGTYGAVVSGTNTLECFYSVYSAAVDQYPCIQSGTAIGTYTPQAFYCTFNYSVCYLLSLVYPWVRL
ncbi:hypothetical protein RQP46_011167 [Phenoliferia psychrophenolica]